MWPQTWSMCTLTRTTTEDSWVPFVCSSVVSLLSCYCFLCQWMIPCAHTVAQVCALFVSSSLPCFMTLSSTSPSTSLSFSSSSLASSTSFCSSPSLRLSRQQPCWGVGSPGLSLLLHKLWAQRLLPHRDLCRVQSGVRNRATVPRRLGLRRHRYRSDALQLVPKTSRSLWRYGLSSPSMSHDWTGKPVVDSDKKSRVRLRNSDKTLKTNRLGLSWTNKGSKSSLIVERRL